MLRTEGAERPTDLVAGVPANVVALDYGPHGGGHGHPDKLGFEMHLMGRLFATDAGSVQYGNPAHGGWYKQTLSHNTVVVDGASQEPTKGELLFHAFGDDAALAGVQSANAYDGVVLRRVMALLPDAMLDITLALSEEQHQYDWALHGRGDLETAGTMSSIEGSPGEGMYEWAEDWKRAASANSLDGDWVLDDKVTVQIGHRALPGGEVFTAIGRGNPASARDPVIMSRTESDDAAWVTGLWWGSDETLQATLLRGARDGVELPVDEALGVGITVGDRRMVLVTADGEGADFGEIMLDGAGALVEFAGDNPVRCIAADATAVTVAGEQLQ
jgi:hypothetical protein